MKYILITLDIFQLALSTDEADEDIKYKIAYEGHRVLILY